ncbi:GNAT family N-acetyltransferase [Olivibacter ginsenosidimutans]|uniref:GNAT family N-acetyltransferase n=1 Tax=Olivibacter ginsenosidimutans TaxID=1176537 RepID=A0ABP9BRV9_9SPHI
MTIEIKPLSNRDTREIIALILPIQQIEHQVPVTINDQPDLLDIEKHYHQGGGGFWGVWHDGILLGTIALIKMEAGQGGVIRKMFVRKEFRGKALGLAQKLLEHLMAYAKKVTIDHLYLGTFHSLKAAIRFYERNSFTQIEKSALPSYFPLMEVDDVFFHLNLTKNE